MNFITQGGEISFDGNSQQSKECKWKSKISDAHGQQNENMRCPTCGEDIPARLFKAHCMRHDIGEMILCKDCNRYFGRAQMTVHLKSAHGGLT
ncbi:unnamed protein product [Blepharisma stoltei]|uniref:C2H2-type domain-containing protein n=1 Tax=Blepharisma stoltei TaxID=1481888 RepID=A0AAU9JAT6_9CILI|nr:unnamed protein product [Blepharisma stoltei]